MLEHDPLPLPKKLYEKALQKKIQKIVLDFEGGNDEGCLHVILYNQGKVWNDVEDEAFTKEVEDWVWDSYDYSGAGDGSRYGDTVTYDLEKMMVRADEWWQVVQEEKGVPQKLKLIDDEDLEEEDVCSESKGTET